jgi:hypothetical protein
MENLDGKFGWKHLDEQWDGKMWMKSLDNLFLMKNMDEQFGWNIFPCGVMYIGHMQF